MKLIRYVIMIALLAIMVMAFTACGGNNSTQPAPTPNPTATPTPTATPDPTPPPATPEPIATPAPAIQPDATEEYLEEMDAFIDAFEDLIEFVFELIDMLEELETDEAFLAWIEAFEIVKEAMAEIVIELDSATPYVPDDYLEPHLLIIASVAMFLESMLELDVSLAAAIQGDYDALWIGLEGFAVNLAVAFALWDEAIYGPVTHAPILIGTWGWEEMPEWVWIFNEDGTGSGGTPGAMDNFVWETSNVFPWLNAVAGELLIYYGANVIEHWEFIVELDHVAHVLVLESLQVEDIVFVYIRQ